MKNEKKTISPLVELRQIRDDHAKKFNNDLDAIFADLKQFEKKNNFKTVSLKPNRKKTALKAV